MDVPSLLGLAVQVLQDKRVIAVAILTIVFISLGNYVVRYRKVVSAPKQKRAPAPKKEKEKKEEKPAEGEEAAAE